MKRMGIRFIIISFIIFISSVTVTNAQEWTEEENKVWELSVKMHKYWAERNLKGYMACLHENYVGWFENSPLPVDKNSLQKWEAINFDTQVIHRYDIRPISIKVTGNVAVVNFYYNALREDANGKKITHTKATRFCIREEERWLVLGVRATRIFNE